MWRYFCKSAVITRILFRDAMIRPARGIFQRGLILKIQHCGNSGKGLTADSSELNDCGLIRIQSESFFHGAPFKDDQVSKVFYIWKDVEPEAMKLQVSEVSGVIWMPLDECRRRVRDNSMPHCILPEELDMLPF